MFVKLLTLSSTFLIGKASQETNQLFGIHKHETWCDLDDLPNTPYTGDYEIPADEMIRNGEEAIQPYIHIGNGKMVPVAMKGKNYSIDKVIVKAENNVPVTDVMGNSIRRACPHDVVMRTLAANASNAQYSDITSCPETTPVGAHDQMWVFKPEPIRSEKRHAHCQDWSRWRQSRDGLRKAQIQSHGQYVPQSVCGRWRPRYPRTRGNPGEGDLQQTNLRCPEQDTEYQSTSSNGRSRSPSHSGNMSSTGSSQSKSESAGMNSTTSVQPKSESEKWGTDPVKNSRKEHKYWSLYNFMAKSKSLW